MKELGLDTKYYFTIGRDLLVCFMETKDGQGPMAIFARGPFGKSVWKVQDDYIGSRPLPQRSDDCEPCPLPKAVNLPIYPLELRGENFPEAPIVSLQELQGFDEDMRKKFGEDFSTWLNWDVYGNYIPFGHREPYHRPRVADFLVTMGLVDAHNKLNVQAHKETPELKAAIEKFDKVDNISVKPIIVTLHLPSDKQLETPPDRMTPLLQTFLREIGEPIDFELKEDFPKMRTTVPVITTLNSFTVVLTPAMGADEEARKTIQDSAENSLIRIIFNESGFELNMKELNEEAKEFSDRQTVLIIEPLGNSLYKVHQIHTYHEIVSPFGPVQTLSAKTLAFNLSIVMQMTNSLASKKAFVNSVKARKSAISDICPESNGLPEFGGIISEQFN